MTVMPRQTILTIILMIAEQGQALFGGWPFLYLHGREYVTRGNAGGPCESDMIKWGDLIKYDVPACG